MKRILYCLLFGWILIVPASILAQDIKALDKLIDKIDKGRNAPGGVISISQGNNSLYSRSFGSADLEQGADFTANTVSESGSVAKQFTATATLLLIDEGKINLNDEVSKYIPELRFYSDTLRIRHLLTHTSGLKDWGVLFGMAGAPRGTRAYTMQHALAVIYRQPTLNFPAGSQYSYSNSNFILLYEIVQRVSGKSFTSFCQERIFQPAGMTHTQWRYDFRNIVPGRAQAYSYNQTTKQYLLDMPFDHVIAAGALLTTVEDLHNWHRFWVKKGFGEKVAAMRTTPGVLTDGRKIDYALGAVFVNPVNGVPCVSHGGLTSGYRTWLAYFPDSDISIAVLCNGVESIPTQDIAKAVLSGKSKNQSSNKSAKTYPLREQQITDYQGTYAATRGHHIIEIQKKNERLYFATGAELLALTKDTLTTGSRKLVYSTDNNHFLSVIGEDTLTYKRVFKTSVTPAQLAVYKGAFFSDDVDAQVIIQVKGDKLSLWRYPGSTVSMTPAYLDAFFMGNDLVKFVFDDKQQITGFYWSSGTGRADNVFFRKTGQ